MTLVHRARQYGFCIIFLFLSNLPVLTNAASSPVTPLTAREWLQSQTGFAYHQILNNLSPADAMPGAVIAAPSRHQPNYYYHWVRDAAIAMETLSTYHDTFATPQQKQLIHQSFSDYIMFTTHIQQLYPQAGLGEPKFNVDGSTFNDPWGRPQNDSPALRAISLTHWAQVLLREGQESVVRHTLYDCQLPANLPIKKDLEYVSHHWQDPSFDLWEEVKGTHFYTLMVSRRALLEGAQLAQTLGDDGAAQWYRLQARQIETVVLHFWDHSRGYFVASLNVSEGTKNKIANLDCSVILGLLHGDMHDGFLAWDDPRVIATLHKVIDTFTPLYSINQRRGIPGIGIGRYPEDVYDGTGFQGGNPWVLCTFAVAEALYRYAFTLNMHHQQQEAQSVEAYADQFVARIKYHTPSDGSLSEQIHRETGAMMSAPDLTWSYAALLTTAYEAGRLSQ